MFHLIASIASVSPSFSLIVLGFEGVGQTSENYLYKSSKQVNTGLWDTEFPLETPNCP